LLVALPAVSVTRTATLCVPSATAAVFHNQLQLVVPDADCQLPPSTATLTAATDTLSAADPSTATVPDTVLPDDGATMVTVGAVLSAFVTVADSDEVDALPDVSVACTAIVCVPSAIEAVGHDHVQDVVPLAVCQAPPSIATATLATDALSEAVPAMLTVPDTFAAAAGAVIATLGGVVSGTGLATVTDSVAAFVLPEVSVARTVMLCAPFAVDVVGHDHVHDVVPLAACQAPPSSWTATEATATLSELLPRTETVPATVEPAVGAVIATVGAVVSRQFLHGLAALAAAGDTRARHSAPATAAASEPVRVACLLICGDRLRLGGGSPLAVADSGRQRRPAHV
jgi:hypothetical protein